MYEKIIDYVLMFFLFSVIGWSVECTYRSLGERRVINTGFLYGPLCPIYGTGAMVFEVFLTPLAKHWWLVLLVGVIAADFVEYLTSYLMEKLFHARWWDYSNEFLNINGRICFKHTCYWALFSVLYVYFIRPVYYYGISFLPQKYHSLIVYVILVIFFADLVNTVIAALDIQKFMVKLEALKLNINMATETVKARAESLKDSANLKYEEFRETIAENSEKFEEWRSDVSAQLSSLRSQYNAYSEKQKNKSVRGSIRRLFDSSTSMRTRTGKRIDEMEEQWNDMNDHLKK